MRIPIIFAFCAGAFVCSVAGVASSSSTYLTALFDAIKDGNVDSVENLIKDQDVNRANDNGRTALHVAAENDNKNIVELLISNGADVNAKDNEKETALHWAALANNDSLVDFLIKSAANVSAEDSTGRTALYFASHNNNEKVAERLLIAGAKMTATPESGKVTPLHVAALHGNEKTAELLVNHGANVNAADSLVKDTPLSYVAFHGTDQYKLFLRQDAASPKYSFRKLAEYSAAKNGQSDQNDAGEKIAELLLKHNADINHQNDKKETPLDKAIQFDNQKLIDLLTGKGAKKGAEIL